jgi:hypothetical protein
MSRHRQFDDTHGVPAVALLGDNLLATVPVETT